MVTALREYLAGLEEAGQSLGSGLLRRLPVPVVVSLPAQPVADGRLAGHSGPVAPGSRPSEPQSESPAFIIPAA